MLIVLSFLLIFTKSSESVLFDISKDCAIEDTTICENVDFSNANEITMNWKPKYLDIETFTVSKSKFRMIPQNLFVALPNLKYLTISAGIERIEKDDFVNGEHLLDLNLTKNHIQELSENIFEYTPNLESIVLVENNISEIHSTAFSGLTKLEVLELRTNNIKSLPRGVFDDLHSLKGLSLSGNEIQSIDENLIRNNRELLILDLQNNRITEIDTSIFRRLQTLKVLTLSNNFIDELQLNSIYMLAVESTGIKNLVIDGTIQELIAGKNEISHLKIANVSKLRRITLGCTSDVDLTFLKDASNLEELILEGGSPNLIHLSAIEEMPNLRNLSIINSNIAEIPDNIFDHLNNVWNLKINKNPLPTVNVNEILKLRNLEYLSLAENKIADFDYKTLFDNAGKLKMVDLRDNPFTCSYLGDVLSYMDIKRITSGFIDENDGSVVNLDKNEIGCD